MLKKATAEQYKKAIQMKEAGRRLVKKLEDERGLVRIYWDSEYGEWLVVPGDDPVGEESTYFTQGVENKDDAFATAADMLKRGVGKIARHKKAIFENPDLSQPSGLSIEGRRAYEVIKKWAVTKGEGFTGGCKTFFSPEEWSKHEDEDFTDAVLIVVHDGGSLSLYREGSTSWITDTQGPLKNLGLSATPISGWFTAIYRDKNIGENAILKTSNRKNANFI